MKIKLTDTRVIFAIMMLFMVIAFVDGIFVTDAASFSDLTWWGTTSLIIGMLPLVFWFGAFIYSKIIWLISLFKK